MPLVVTPILIPTLRQPTINLPCAFTICIFRLIHKSGTIIYGLLSLSSFTPHAVTEVHHSCLLSHTKNILDSKNTKPTATSEVLHLSLCMDRFFSCCQHYLLLHFIQSPLYMSS